MRPNSTVVEPRSSPASVPARLRASLTDVALFMACRDRDRAEAQGGEEAEPRVRHGRADIDDRDRIAGAEVAKARRRVARVRDAPIRDLHLSGAPPFHARRLAGNDGAGGRETARVIL